MDTFRSNHEERDLDSGYAYEAEDLPASTPVPSRGSNSGFGFGLLRALRLSNQASPMPAEETSLEKERVLDDSLAEFAGFVNTARTYVDPTPVYKGHYNNLSPLYFNTEPVDNANDTRLERSKLTSYSRAQLFFLLRLERFLRLRHYWLKANPRSDEEWKTRLVTRGIFSALEDCIKHDVCDDAKQLLVRWGCC